MFSEAELEKAWREALAYLEAQGADVEAMLRQGAENIERYRSEKLRFPAEFPADEH